MVKLRVVAYNVRSLRDDRSAVIRVLRELDADVVCVQEAPRFFRWRSKCAALARESGLLYVGGGRTANGVAMLAAHRVDVSSVIEYRLSRTPRLIRRGLVAARIHKAGAWCTVASVHLGLDAAERPRHRREIIGVVNRYDSPVTIVAGDINETPGMPTWRELAAEFTDAGVPDGEPTYSARDPRRRIDGVFVRGPATVQSCWVVEGSDVEAASDHRPVVVDLEVPAGDLTAR
ncbi:MAG TPA: endonuclease/exonuclease/phosphatase family protein [Jiangellaceae bacterium]|nr:endonuclease/exonuclease/phosphatase family protein [Jiangellaceae bacterium]